MASVRDIQITFHYDAFDRCSETEIVGPGYTARWHGRLTPDEIHQVITRGPWSITTPRSVFDAKGRPRSRHRHEVNWSTIRPYLGPAKFAAGFAALLLVITASTFLWLTIPFSRLSIVRVEVFVWRMMFGGSLHITDPDYSAGGPGWTAVPLGLIVIGLACLFFRFMPRLAYREESIYRRGLEQRTPGQRFKTTARFAALHLWNLIVPISLAVGLMLPASLFLAVYLRSVRRTGDEEEAVMQSTAAHVAYNSWAGLLLLAFGVGTLLR